MASRERPTPPRLDPAFAGELIGAEVALEHPGIAGGAIAGTLVDETMNTFVVRRPVSDRNVRVPKAGASGTIFLGGRPLPLSGNLLRLRPEDRTKRIAARGRRR